MRMGRESWRKIVHISMVGWALLIGRVPPLFIVLLALTALLFNIFLLPRLTRRSMEREEDIRLGFSLGMLAYPVMVLFLSMLFYRQQIYLAIAWGAMAFGDGFATVVGSRWGRREIGTSGKTWLGSFSFFVIGTLLTLLLLGLLPSSTRLGLAPYVWIMAVLTAMLLSAIMETVKGMINDNIIVPLVAGAAAYAFIQAWIHGQFPIPDNWYVGLAFISFLIIASFASGKFSLWGALTGGGISACIFLGSNLEGLLLLIMFVVPGVFSSAWKFREKVAIGVAQENRGKRTVNHVIANGGVAAICGLMGWFFPLQAPLFTGMMASSLASALADTVSSEMGNIYGRKFINIVTWKTDQRGLDGVISLAGTLFGVAGSLLVALTFACWNGFHLAFFLVFLCGILGTLIDSVLGATLQRAGYLTNHSVNLVNTLFAALSFYCLCLL
jgi:uncharacterized protein (TIGR00297 family)